MDNRDEKNRQKINSPWAFAAEGLQLTITVLLFLYIGYRLDQWRETEPWFMVTGGLIGIVIGLYGFLKRFLVK